MRTLIKRLNNPETGAETGCILTAMPPFGGTLKAKQKLVDALRHYAAGVIYPKEGLNIYASVHDDTPSIVVIRDINNIPDSEQDLELAL